MAALFDRKTLLEEISLYLSTMESCLKWHTGRGHNDIAKVLEDVVARFLAVVCDWNLKNLNSIRPNYPVGDLGDFEKRIAIQVTVDGTTKKVADTHTKATQHKFSQDFDRLIICFLLEKAPTNPRKSKVFTPCSNPKIENWARPQINALLDARSDEDAAAHLNRLRRAAHALRDELSALRDILSPALPYRPRNLPFVSIGTHFKGRGYFLNSLHTAFSGGDAAVSKPVAIRGDGGIGKTSAAVEYAWRHFLEYSALLFVTADSAQSLESGLAALGAAGVLSLSGHTDRKHPEQLAAVIHHLQTHPDWLLILDNADTSEAIQAVKGFLPRLDGGRILITTRRNTAISQFIPLDLDYLNEADSIALLEDKTAGHRRLASDDATALPELARILGGLPLALTQTAAHIAWQRLSWREYLSLWESNASIALTWYNEEVMDYPRCLAVTYETSVAQLGAEANELLRMLAWFSPEPIPLFLLETKRAPEESGTILAELERLCLVRRRDDGQAFSVHRVLQEITRRQQYGTQALLSLTPALFWINAAFPLDSDDVRTWSSTTPLVPHAECVAIHAAEHLLYEPTTRLLNQVALFHQAKANYIAAEQLYGRAIAIDEAAKGPNHPILAVRCSNLATLLMDTNRYSEAEPLIRRALAIDEKSAVQHPLKVARHYSNLAQVFHGTNRLAEAEPLMRQSLEISEDYILETPGTVALNLNNLAALLQDTNRVEEAEPLMQRALAIDEACLGKDHPHVARDLNNLAGLFLDTNFHEKAEPLLRRALAIWEKSLGAQHPLVAGALNNLAGLLQETKRFSEAEPMLHRALAIDRNSLGEDHPCVARDLGTLAQLLEATNRVADAVPLLRRAIEILVIFTRATGHPHPHLQAAVNNYSEMLFQLEKTENEVRETIDEMLAPIGGRWIPSSQHTD